MPTDPNIFAKNVLDKIIAEHDPEAAPEPQPVEKNPKRQAAGKASGEKAGKARAKNLTPAKRSEIAKKAAKARWDKSEQ